LQDNGNGTVSDLKTGLMWKKCAEGLSGNNCSSGSLLSFNWKMALEQSGIVNAVGFSAFNDWRLPNIKELNSIVEKQCYDPAINVSHFPNTPASIFWSGSAFANASASTHAWNVHFNNGISYYDYRNSSYSVRLVRGGQ
jgi:hypothetical protein